LNSYELGGIRRVIFCEGDDGPANSGAQLDWRDDFGGRAPTEYPLFNFIESSEAQTEFQPPDRQFTHLLRFMPFAFTHAFGDGGFETDHDAIVAGAAEYAESVGKEFLRRELSRPDEGLFGNDDLCDSGQGERAERLPLQIEADEVPGVFTVGQMVRP